MYAVKFLQINVFAITIRIYAKEVAVFQIFSIHFSLTPKKTLLQASLHNYRNNYISLNIFGLLSEYKTKTTQMESTKPLFLGDTIFEKINSSLNNSSKGAAFIKKLGKNSIHSF